MGRDRAKEKIQAHRKAKLDRKEAKQDIPLKHKKGLENPSTEIKGRNQRNQPTNTIHKRMIKDYYPTGGEGIQQNLVLGASASYEEPQLGACGFSPEQTSSDITYGDPPSTLKGEKSTKLSKLIGNPNHRISHKPIWRQLHQENSQIKDKSNKLKNANQKQEQSASVSNLEDSLRPEERNDLRDLLQNLGLEEVSSAVAAVALGRFDLVKRLIREDKFGPDVVEGEKVTPIGCAILTNNWEMIEFILDKNLNVHCKDDFGNTPLIKAAICLSWTSQSMFNLWMMMKFETETDISASNKAGVTLIHALVYRGWLNTLEDVIDYVAQHKNGKNIVNSLINGRMIDGTTPLMLAVDREDPLMSSFLLSKGASPVAEDKAGFTPLCRAFSCVYKDLASFTRNCVPPTCRIIVEAVFDYENINDFEAYAARRLHIAMNPNFEGCFFNERFYRLGRTAFIFLVRGISKGIETLLNLRFFPRLVSSGQRNIQHTDFVYTLCTIFFEVLTYAQDFCSIYPQYTNSFLTDGAADFCLKLIQKQSVHCDLDSSNEQEQISYATSVSEVSSKVQEMRDNRESLSFLEEPFLLPSDKNLGFASLLSFIQLVDCPEMEPWFSSHFQTLSSCFHNLIEKSGKFATFVLNTSLGPEHAERFNRKTILFATLMANKKWISPYKTKVVLQPPQQESRNKKKKRNKKSLHKSIDNYLARLPPSSTFNKPLPRQLSKLNVPKSQLFIKNKDNNIATNNSNSVSSTCQEKNSSAQKTTQVIGRTLLHADLKTELTLVLKKLDKAENKLRKLVIEEVDLLLFGEWGSNLDGGIWQDCKIGFYSNLDWVIQARNINMPDIVKCLCLGPDLYEIVLQYAVDTQFLRFTAEGYFKNPEIPLAVIQVISTGHSLILIHKTFGPMIWNRRTLASKYLTKDIDDITMEELFDDTVYSYPDWNSFFGEPTWTTFDSLISQSDSSIVRINIFGKDDGADFVHWILQKGKFLTSFCSMMSLLPQIRVAKDHTLFVNSSALKYKRAETKPKATKYERRLKKNINAKCTKAVQKDAVNKFFKEKNATSTSAVTTNSKRPSITIKEATAMQKVLSEVITAATTSDTSLSNEAIFSKSDTELKMDEHLATTFKKNPGLSCVIREFFERNKIISSKDSSQTSSTKEIKKSCTLFTKLCMSDIPFGTNIFYVSDLSKSLDREDWIHNRKEMLSRKITYQPEASQVRKFVKKMLLSIENPPMVEHQPLSVLFLGESDFYTCRSELLDTADCMEFAKILKLWERLPNLHIFLNWNWIQNRREILKEYYHSTILIKVEFIKKYLFKRFDSKNSFEILEDVENCYGVCGIRELNFHPKEFFYSLETDAESGLTFVRKRNRGESSESFRINFVMADPTEYQDINNNGCKLGEMFRQALKIPSHSFASDEILYFSKFRQTFKEVRNVGTQTLLVDKEIAIKITSSSSKESKVILQDERLKCVVPDLEAPVYSVPQQVPSSTHFQCKKVSAYTLAKEFESLFKEKRKVKGQAFPETPQLQLGTTFEGQISCVEQVIPETNQNDSEEIVNDREDLRTESEALSRMQTSSTVENAHNQPNIQKKHSRNVRTQTIKYSIQF